MREAVAIFLALWAVLKFTHYAQHQARVGVDAPLSMEAAGCRGELDGPYFGTRQAARGIFWAYNGPRPLLFLFWPLAGLWKRKEPLANGLFTLIMAGMTVWAAWLLWPAGLGLWIVPTLAVFWFGYQGNLELGMANPITLLLGAAAYLVPDPWLAWLLVGVAISMRVHSVVLIPFVWLLQGIDLGGFLMMWCGYWVMSGAALVAGFGYETPKRLWRLMWALQITARKKGKSEMCLHLRRAYWILIPLLWPWPAFACAAAILALVHAVIVDNVRMWGPVPPEYDVAVRLAGPIWHETWRD